MQTSQRLDQDRKLTAAHFLTSTVFRITPTTSGTTQTTVTTRCRRSLRHVFRDSTFWPTTHGLQSKTMMVTTSSTTVHLVVAQRASTALTCSFSPRFGICQSAAVRGFWAAHPKGGIT